MKGEKERAVRPSPLFSRQPPPFCPRYRMNGCRMTYSSFILHPSSFGLLVRLQHGQKRLLRDLDLADLLHALLARGLLGPQLALARDVAAVTLRRHVLLHRRDVLPR